MNKIKIDTLIEKLKSNTVILELFGNNIFYIKSKKSVNTDYLCIKDLISFEDCNTTYTIEFRIISGGSDEGGLVITDKADKLRKELVGFSKFGYSNIILKKYNPPLENSDNRWEVTRIFKFLV